MKKRIISASLVLVMMVVVIVIGHMDVSALSAGAGQKVIEGGQRDFKWPVQGWYGLSGCFMDGRSHYALDIPASRGTSVLASYNGIVVEVTYNGNNDGGYGNAVMVEHTYKKSDGNTVTLYTRYAHMNSVDVSVGDTVYGGITRLGGVGGSGYGNSDYYGNHLDFQILTSTNWRNRSTCSIDPYINELLELPSSIYTASSNSCCGVGPTGCCCYYYLQDVKAIYSVPLSYLGQCKSYPANCTIKVSSSTTYIKSLPCSEKTDANSTNVEVAKKGDQYQAIGLMENTAGNLWYKVTAKNGSVGYMYAGDTTYLAQNISDIEGSGITAPTNHTAGAVYVLTGSVSATYNQLTEVSAYVYAGNSEQGTKETGAAAAVNGNTYSLGGSTIDKQTEYNKLSVGTHTYVVWASYKNYYAKSATSLGTNSGTIGVYKATFNVVNGAASCSHSYSSKVTTVATCVDPGVITYTCSGCSASYTETIPASGHNYSVDTIYGNCTTTNKLIYTCANCGDSYEVDSNEYWDHNYELIITEPTCTESGVSYFVCSICGDSNLYEEYAPVGHNYSTQLIPATCTQAERIRHTCQTCGYTYENYTTEEYGDWSTTKPIGVSEDLIENKTQYRYRSISYSTEYSSWGAWSAWQDTAVSATELKEVETQTLYPYYYFYCKVCGDGTRWYSYGGKCGNCGTVMESSSGTVVWLDTSWDLATPYRPFGSDTGKYAIVLNGLTYWKWTDGSPITQYRYRTRTAQQVANYGQWSDWADDVYTQSSERDVDTRIVYRYTNTQLGDHDWDNGTVTTKPGCTTNGEKTFNCEICGTTRTEVVSATGLHDWGQWRVLEEPTCEMTGTSIRQCTNCSARDVKFTNPLGHSLKEVPGYAATCTKPGLTEGIVCENCGEVAVSQKEIPVADHTYIQGVCSVCGKGECPVGGYVDGTYTGYEDLASAIAAGGWVKLYADATVNVTLTQDLYIDLNGYDLSGTIATNGYKIYGMDSTTDSYTCETIGYMNLVDENGNEIDPVSHFNSDITGTTKRYMAIKDENGWSFHRFYLGVTHMSLKPTTTGVGYKGVFYGDRMVAANLGSFGFTLQLQGNDPVTVTLAADKFVSGKTFTLRIDNFDVERYGETALLACATLQLSDGTVIQSTAASMTMRSLMEQLDTVADTLSEAQLTTIKAMIEKYAIIKSWKVENLI